MFGWRKKQRELDRQFRRDSRLAELELARAIAEQLQPGDAKERMMERIAEEERKAKQS